MDKSPETISPKEFSLKIFGKTEASIEHPERNEDAIGFDQQGKWAVLLDGMGGLDAGDEASRTALDAIVKRIAKIKDNADPSKAQQEIAKAFNEASEQVKKRVPKGGTTAVAVKVVGRDRKIAVITSVGDSRLYRFRQGDLEQITQDDSRIPIPLREKLDNVSEENELSEDELNYYKMRKYITGHLGQKEPLNVHTYTVELSEGDNLVLTSDGVHDNLTASEIQVALESGTELADKLVEASFNRAMQEGSHFRAKKDDISAIIIEFSGRKTPKSEMKTPSIAEAQSFDELYQSLNSLGEIRGSRGSFTAAELASLIDLVRTHKLDISLITRAEGIREKVVELLEKE